MKALVKHKVAIGIAALAVMSMTGGALAATQDNSDSTSFLNDVASRLHVTPAQLTAAIKGATIDRLNAAVAAGKLTRAQANAIEKRINSGVPFGPFGLGPVLVPGIVGPMAYPRPVLPPGAFAAPVPLPYPGGKLRMFKGRPWPYLPLPYPAAKLRMYKGRPVPVLPRALLGPPPFFGPGQAAAKYLGLTQAQLLEQASSGKTLAQIAKSRGKSVSGLEAALAAAEKAGLAAAVKAKMITPALEQRMLADLNARIAALVTSSLRPPLPVLPWLLARPQGLVPVPVPAGPPSGTASGRGTAASAAPVPGTI